MDIMDQMDKLVEANHKIGRSEALCEVSRILHEELTKLDKRIEERSRLLSTDSEFKGYVSDDSIINELRTIRTTMNFIHRKVIEL